MQSHVLFIVCYPYVSNMTLALLYWIGLHRCTKLIQGHMTLSTPSHIYIQLRWRCARAHLRAYWKRAYSRPYTQVNSSFETIKAFCSHTYKNDDIVEEGIISMDKSNALHWLWPGSNRYWARTLEHGNHIWIWTCTTQTVWLWVWNLAKWLNTIISLKRLRTGKWHATKPKLWSIGPKLEPLK